MHDLVAYKAATSEEQEAIPLPRILIIDDSPAIHKPFHLCDLLAEVEHVIPLASQREHGRLRAERSC